MSIQNQALATALSTVNETVFISECSTFPCVMQIKIFAMDPMLKRKLRKSEHPIWASSLVDTDAADLRIQLILRESTYIFNIKMPK